MCEPLVLLYLAATRDSMDEDDTTEAPVDILATDDVMAVFLFSLPQQSILRNSA